MEVIVNWTLITLLTLTLFSFVLSSLLCNYFKDFQVLSSNTQAFQANMLFTVEIRSNSRSKVTFSRAYLGPTWVLPWLLAYLLSYHVVMYYVLILS